MLPASIAPSAAPGADDRVQLVDEEDDLALVLGHLVDHRLQPLLELAAVLRAGDQAGQVERDKPAIGQRLRHLVVDDPLRDALDDRGLADAGIADQRRIVLRPTREDLDRLLDLARPPDHRIQLSLAGLNRQITPVLVKRRRRRRLARSAAGLDTPDHGAAQLRVRDTETLHQLPGPRLRIAGQREQHVLRADVGRAELARLLVRSEQRRLRIRRQRRRNVGTLTAIGLLLDLCRDRVRIRIDLAEDMPDDPVLHRGVQQVVGIEVEAAPLDRRLRRALQKLARRIAEELRHVDPLRTTRRRFDRTSGRSRRVGKEIGEEIVEKAASPETAPHPVFRKTQIAQVLSLGRLTWERPLARRNRGPLMTLAEVVRRHAEPPSCLMAARVWQVCARAYRSRTDLKQVALGDGPFRLYSSSAQVTPADTR